MSDLPKPLELQSWAAGDNNWKGRRWFSGLRHQIRPIRLKALGGAVSGGRIGTNIFFAKLEGTASRVPLWPRFPPSVLRPRWFYWSMISGGLSTPGIDFPPKMLSLSLGSSVIGGSLSDREPPPVLAVATPAQPGNYDWWGSCEGARAPVTQERPSSETPPSPMAGQLPTLGRRGSTFSSYPHSITHIFARCLYIFGSRCLLQPNSCAPKRWKFWQIDLARSPKPFPHQVDNVLARGPPG